MSKSFSTTVRSIVALTSIASGLANASEFPQFPNTIRIIEAETLPIDLIKEECLKINSGENVSRCITNTMNHWTAYRRSIEEHPEAAALCYESLRDLDDYIVVNNCIDAAVGS